MVPHGSSNLVDSTTCIASGPGGGTSFGAGHVAGRCHSLDPSAPGCAPCQCCTDGSSAWSAFRAHGSASSCSLGGSTGRMPCTAWELSLGAQRSADAPQPMALSRKGLALSSWPQGNVPIHLLATRILAKDPVRPSNGLGTCTDVRSRFSGSAATLKACQNVERQRQKDLCSYRWGFACGCWTRPYANHALRPYCEVQWLPKHFMKQTPIELG